ncbi:MAG: amidase family protein, partial [bacterium]|nr:amidase family protein [bacterium]
MTAGGPATTIAAAVRAGERSATSAVEESLAAVASGGDLGAFNTVTAEAALTRAAAIDSALAAGEDPGPLAGVPVALKDNICTRGVPTTCSSRILEGWEPPYDATVVDLLNAAGAVV